jgi:hypothetical protein
MAQSFRALYLAESCPIGRAGILAGPAIFLLPLLPYILPMHPSRLQQAVLTPTARISARLTRQMQTCPACDRLQTYIPIFTDMQQPFIWIIGTGNAKLEANLHA